LEAGVLLRAQKHNRPGNFAQDCRQSLAAAKPAGAADRDSGAPLPGA
jgi:hypothetical protein